MLRGFFFLFTNVTSVILHLLSIYSGNLSRLTYRLNKLKCSFLFLHMVANCLLLPQIFLEMCFIKAHIPTCSQDYCRRAPCAITSLHIWNKNIVKFIVGGD